jgi:DNA-binding SARP family transcriptional activator/tetratricopeptide (TPR) repeat protein
VVEIDGVRLEKRIPGRKGRQLVAYLAVNLHRAVRRDELIDALWPTDPPNSPEGTLATLLARTRAALGAGVIPGGTHLRLELPADARIDWDAAHQGAARAVEARKSGDPLEALRIAEDALGIVEQGFLPDAEGSWIEERRRELDELRVELCDVLARAALELGGDYLATAERAARAIVKREPFRERGHALLIEVLSAGGNDAEALRTFDRLRTLLREQLGLTPAPAVTALAERLLRRRAESEPTATGTGDERRSPASDERALERPVALPHAIAAVAERPVSGREPERRRLVAIAEDVARGNRRMALVCGEPGIGKTHLVVHVADELRENGWRVMYGRADRDSALTYQPVLEALRDHMGAQSGLEPEIEAVLAPAFADFGVGDPANEAPSTRVVEESSSGDADLQRFRWFEAVAGLLAAAAAERPVMLLLDDLHWADRSTLTLLRHVLRATAGCRLYVLATFRDLEEEVRRPLRDFLDSLWHDELYEALKLDGLPLAETEDLVGRHMPGAAPELVARLHDRTDGNPFYVEELLRGLAEAQGADVPALSASAHFPIPERLMQMIVWRVERLPPPAPEVLRVGAVLGPEFDATHAAEIASCSVESVLQALEKARRAGLVTADAERIDWYAFRHALVREALSDATPPGPRARTHLAVAQLIEKEPAADAARRAVHWWHARTIGGAERAVHWHVEAAHDATRKHAHEESVRLHRRAIQALELLPPDDRRHSELVLGEGRSLIRAGDLGAGRDRLAHAAALARQLGAADLLADSVIDSGAFYLSAGRIDEQLVEVLEEARTGLAGSDAPGDRARLARVSARLAVALYWDPGRRARREALAREAVRIATDCGDQGALAFAVGSEHCVHWRSERAPQLLAHAERTIQLAQRAHDEELELIARTWRVNHLLAMTRVREVDEEIERFTALAERMRQSRCVWYAPLFRAARLLMNGRFEEAERLISSAAELGGRIPDSPAALIAGGQLFVLRWLQGRLAELEPAIDSFVAQFPAVLAWRVASAKVRAVSGQRDAAHALVDELMADDCAVIPRDNLWLIAMAVLGDTCADIEAREHAPALERVLAPCSGLSAILPTAAWLGPVDRVLARLVALQGRWDEALDYLTRAALLCERAKCPVPLVEVRLDKADVLLARGRPADVEPARAAARAALAGADTMGMRAAGARALDILERTDREHVDRARAEGSHASA